MKQNENNTKTATNKEDRIAFAIGVIVVLAILAIIVGLITAAGNKNARLASTGEITAPQNVRRGTEQTLTYTTDKLQQGDVVTWYVNNEKVAETQFDGKVATFNYTPDQCGKTVVRAVSGHYSKSMTLDVNKPILTVTANDTTITYGQELPKLTYKVEGFVGEDTAEKLGYNFECKAKNCKDVGVWEIGVNGCQIEDYEVEYKTAHLTVLPKTISISNTVTKEYDQTNTVKNPELVLDGVMEGDQVTAQCDVAYFQSKNAGYQKLMTANICLTGKDAHNYVLCDDAQGYISPKRISLTGVTLNDKYYDGSTKAEINNPGKLNGVIKGDSVAIGGIDVRFDGANVGTHTAKPNKIILIGVDKDNYVVTDWQIREGHILEQK